MIQPRRIPVGMVSARQVGEKAHHHVLLIVGIVVMVFVIMVRQARLVVRIVLPQAPRRAGASPHLEEILVIAASREEGAVHPPEGVVLLPVVMVL